MGLVNTNEFHGQGIDDFMLDFQFDTNNTGTPANVAPAYGSDMAVTYAASAGKFNVTFPASRKPYKVRAIAQIVGDEPDLHAKVISYTRSTGVLLIGVYQNVAGTVTLTNTTGKTVAVHAVCSRNSRSP